MELNYEATNKGLEYKPKNDLFLLQNNISENVKNFDFEMFTFNRNTLPTKLDIDNHKEDFNGSTSLKSQIEHIIYGLSNRIGTAAACGNTVKDYTAKDYNKTLNIGVMPIAMGYRTSNLLENIEKYKELWEDSPEGAERIKAPFNRISGTITKIKFGHISYPVYLISQTKKTDFLENYGDMALFSVDKNQKTTIIDDEQDTVFKLNKNVDAIFYGDEVFILNNTVFDKMFDFDRRIRDKAEAVAKLLHEKLNISTPGTISQTIDFLVRDKPTLLKRLANLDSNGSNIFNIDDGSLTQNDIVETADDYQIELMTSDHGELIIMDHTDVKALLDIIEENYYKGESGKVYLTKSKEYLWEESKPE